MQAMVIKVNDGEGQVLLSYKRMLAERGNQRLREAFENQEVLTAKVAQVVNGGLSVVMDEARIFIPASLVSDTYERDLSKYNGQEISFVITEFNPRRRRIIGDRKQLLIAQKAKMQEELFARIQIGDVMEGTVKNVTDSARSSTWAAQTVCYIFPRSPGDAWRTRRRFSSPEMWSEYSSRIFMTRRSR